MTTMIIGAGLVGCQVARILVAQGERPVLLDRAFQAGSVAQIVPLDSVDSVVVDVLKPLTIAAALGRYAPTRLVHLAANPMLTIGGQRDPYGAVELNIMGTMNVLEAARSAGVKRVVIASSNTLNHHLDRGAATGNSLAEDSFPRPISFYATCKQTIENLGLNYARWFDMEFAALRYGAVCGPWSGAGGGGPSNVFLTLLRDALAGREATVPDTTLEWVYSKDAAMATVLALTAARLGDDPPNGGVFNITMGCDVNAVALEQAVRTVIPGARTRRVPPPLDTPALRANLGVSDISRARSALGYAPAFDITAAVRDTVAWLETTEPSPKKQST